MVIISLRYKSKLLFIFIQCTIVIVAAKENNLILETAA